MSLLLGVVLGIICFVGFGLSDYFGALSSRKIGAFQSVIVSRIFSLTIMLVILLAFFKLPSIAPITWALLAVTSLLLLLGYMCFYKGFKVGMVSIISPIANSAVIITLVLALLFLSYTLTTFEAVGIVLIIVGTLLVSFELKELKKLNFKIAVKGFWYAIGAMLFWGIGSFLVIILVDQLGWFVPIFLVYVFYFTYSVIYAASRRVKFTKLRPALPITALTGILATIGFLAYSIGITLNYTLIVLVLLGAAPTLTVILALTRLKEKLEINHKLGVLLILVSLVLLSL
ncbi:MAG TPA: EamA family transporter [Candidatus Acidoferrum sp.]|nr:EamA family transporter [Candidatus Acidoferrum sp.]